MTHNLKEGDLVEFTSLKGKVDRVYSDGSVLFRGDGNASFHLNRATVDQARITKLKPPLKVGRAMLKRSGYKGRVIALHENRAWFRYDNNGRDFIYSTDDFLNIPEEDEQ